MITVKFPDGSLVQVTVSDDRIAVPAFRELLGSVIGDKAGVFVNGSRLRSRYSGTSCVRLRATPRPVAVHDLVMDR
jgi:hypothetical protein